MRFSWLIDGVWRLVCPILGAVLTAGLVAHRLTRGVWAELRRFK